MSQVLMSTAKNENYSEYTGISSAAAIGDFKSYLSGGFLGCNITEDEEFLMILEEFGYSAEEAGKALRFAGACMNHLMNGLI